MTKDPANPTLAERLDPATVRKLETRNRELELIVRQRAVDQAIEVKDGLVYLFQQALAGDAQARALCVDLDRLLSQLRLASAGWPAASNGQAKGG